MLTVITPWPSRQSYGHSTYVIILLQALSAIPWSANSHHWSELHGGSSNVEGGIGSNVKPKSRSSPKSRRNSLNANLPFYSAVKSWSSKHSGERSRSNPWFYANGRKGRRMLYWGNWWNLNSWPREFGLSLNWKRLKYWYRRPLPETLRLPGHPTESQFARPLSSLLKTFQNLISSLHAVIRLDRSLNWWFSIDTCTCISALKIRIRLMHYIRTGLRCRPTRVVSGTCHGILWDTIGSKLKPCAHPNLESQSFWGCTIFLKWDWSGVILAPFRARQIRL